MIYQIVQQGLWDIDPVQAHECLYSFHNNMKYIFEHLWGIVLTSSRIPRAVYSNSAASS